MNLNYLSRMVQAAVFFMFALSFAGASLANPLHDAVKNNDLAAAKAAIVQGADINEHGENGETPLTQAIIEGRTDLVVLLLDQGVAVDSRNVGGFTALHAAAYVGSKDIAEMLLDRAAKIDDQLNRAGVTALSVAAEENHLEVARKLVSRGAATELADKNGYTPLTRAIWRGHSDIINFLQKAGARCQPVEILEEPTFSECMKGQK